jgi:WXG100 family type VII secretion target
MFIKVDTEALGAAFSTFQTQLGTIESSRAALQNAIMNVEWQGPAAAEFRQQWQSVHEPALRRLHEAIEHYSRAMRAQNQRYEANR